MKHLLITYILEMLFAADEETVDQIFKMLIFLK